jgi:hypothetical protein
LNKIYKAYKAQFTRDMSTFSESEIRDEQAILDENMDIDIEDDKKSN